MKLKLGRILGENNKHTVDYQRLIGLPLIMTMACLYKILRRFSWRNLTKIPYLLDIDFFSILFKVKCLYQFVIDLGDLCWVFSSLTTIHDGDIFQVSINLDFIELTLRPKLLNPTSLFDLINLFFGLLLGYGLMPLITFIYSN